MCPPRDATVQRLDPAHRPAAARVAPRPRAPEPAAAGAECRPLEADLLRMHAEDLIVHLRRWAADLDHREATLNAWSAQQDLRERDLQTRRQLWSAEMAEQRRALGRLREETERLRRELRRQARRLAFEQAATTP